MSKPKFIIFDYGETLIRETAFNSIKGYEAILEAAKLNPLGATAEDLLRLDEETYPMIRKCFREYDVEVNNIAHQRLVCESFGLEFDISYDEVDTIFWNAAAPGTMCENADKLLDYLDMSAIGYGVLSNMGFSGISLTSRVMSIFPEYNFKYIMASSDYAIRKPRTELFRLAAYKSGFEKEDIWFVGDNPLCDVMGASRAGMTPVLYKSGILCPYRDIEKDPRPDCEYIEVHDLIEIKDIIESRV